jgi:uncharacterized iron-regulated protein
MRAALLFLCFIGFAFQPDKPAYQLYTASLKAATYHKLAQQAASADVVLFGELHNNALCHWLELQLTKSLQQEKKGALVLGAEMFEADNQQALTDYVDGRTTDKEFATQARLWPNFNTDYKPLVDLARENKVPFVATNVPRKYASLVARKGLTALDTLSAEAKGQIATLPITVDLTLPGYKGMLEMMGGHSSDSQTANPHGGNADVSANFARAQAIKDATMAHFILQNLKAGQTLLHFNGDYHSKNFEGIVWYLRKQRPDLKIVTISTVELPDIEHPKADNKQLADFILAIPDDMAKTY